MVALHSGGTRGVAVFGMTRTDAAKARFLQAFPERNGRIERGILTRLYDERFGIYERANDVGKRLETIEVGAPRGIREYKIKPETSSPLLFRMDVVAEALFLGGAFEARGPVADLERYHGAVVQERGYVLVVGLEHAERGLRGTLLLDADEGRIVPEHNFLMLKRIGEEKAYQLYLNEFGLIVFPVDAFAVVAETMALRTTMYPPNNLYADVRYSRLQEAFDALRRRVGMPDVHLA